MGIRIGLTYDLKTDWIAGHSEPTDANAEFDKPETVESIVKALEESGHSVERIGNVHSLISRLDHMDVDIVFNLCEGRIGRNRESEVPVLLEMKGVPFVGSDGLTLALTLDKPMAKKIFIAEGIPTPGFFTAEAGDDLKALNTIGYPLIVKTSREGSSKGIHKDSKVNDLQQLKKRVEFINTTYNQPALVEEFVKGYEYTVAVIGNHPPQVMPIVQTTINGKLNLGEEFYTNERIYSNAVRYVCPADISESLKARIENLSVRVFKAVGCRDLGRIDFRVDEGENPYVLEINPLPSFDKEDVFNIFPEVIGSNFSGVLNKIIDFAMERYPLSEYDMDKKNKSAGSAVN